MLLRKDTVSILVDLAKPERVSLVELRLDSRFWYCFSHLFSTLGFLRYGF